jgi:TetR/AcrR family transcriptional regulator, transcriptional repressor for nem operon
MCYAVFAMARPREFDEHTALQRAMQVFWRKGFEATSLTDLLKATGLSKSSLYQTFTDKRSLFLAALETYRQHRMQRLRGKLNDGRSARESIETFFTDIVGHTTDKERPYGCMSCNEAVEMSPDDEEVRRLVAADFQAVEDLFADAVRRGQKDGSIRNQGSSRALARFLTVNLQGLHVMARAQVDASRLRDNVKVMLSTLDQPRIASPAKPRAQVAHPSGG